MFIFILTLLAILILAWFVLMGLWVFFMAVRILVFMLQIVVHICMAALYLYDRSKRLFVSRKPTEHQIEFDLKRNEWKVLD